MDNKDTYVIDTSTLIMLSRYYHPFDDKSVMYQFIESQLSQGSLIVLPTVFDECLWTSQKLALETYPFIEKLKMANHTATSRQHRQLSNSWSVSKIKQKLDDSEFESMKSTYIASADFQLIAHASLIENLTIVTEESSYSNDKKPFKKIPAICKLENIRCVNLVQWLQDNNFSSDFDFKPYP